MSTGSTIEWTEATWNPVVGCTRASAGCDNCYAVTMTHRLEAMGQSKYAGLTVLNNRGDRHFNGVVRTVPEALAIPLKWRKPRRVFVNSMSDLFHRDVPFEFIDKVFAVMALCPQHTFQVLTKRPERMAEYLRPVGDHVCAKLERLGKIREAVWNIGFEAGLSDALMVKAEDFDVDDGWPLPNVWLGTSCEDQARADERIPHLLKCPAAVRFLSCEPLLGPLNIIWPLSELADDHHWMEAHEWAGECELCGGEGFREYLDAPDEWGEDSPSEANHLIPCRGCREREREVREHVVWLSRLLHWVIVGGESGPGARAYRISWPLSIIRQCRSARIPVFHKQLGACAFDDLSWAGADPQLQTRDAKGGDPAEWPEDLRVREFPR